MSTTSFVNAVVLGSQNFNRGIEIEGSKELGKHILFHSKHDGMNPFKDFSIFIFYKPLTFSWNMLDFYYSLGKPQTVRQGSRKAQFRMGRCAGSSVLPMVCSGTTWRLSNVARQPKLLRTNRTKHALKMFGDPNDYLHSFQSKNVSLCTIGDCFLTEGRRGGFCFFKIKA